VVIGRSKQTTQCFMYSFQQTTNLQGVYLRERLPAELLPANMKCCPLCNIPKKSHIKRHILRTHLPWFWSPTTACWACEEQSCYKSSLIYHHSVLHAHNDNNTFDENNLHRWCQLMNRAFYLLLDWIYINIYIVGKLKPMVHLHPMKKDAWNVML
jgi:hypothetical protein